MLKRSKINKSHIIWAFIILCLCFILILMYSIYLYTQTLADKDNNHKQVKEKVLEKTDLNMVTSITEFHGVISYYIVKGETADKKSQHIFVPMNNEHDTIVKKDSHIISKEAVKRDWQSSCNNCDFIKIKAAMIDETPLWEITYSTKNHYIFEYINMDDGQTFQRWPLNKT